MRLLLGVDIGTTATKAILLDPDAGIVAQAERPSVIHADQPGWARRQPSTTPMPAGRSWA
ncbi:MAG: hypothetical protein LH650_14550 [Chloroflexi bacterium]|nr:hypothetical protein [Chloroflexota bacterium]